MWLKGTYNGNVDKIDEAIKNFIEIDKLREDRIKIGFVKTTIVDDVEFSITKITGSKKEKTITVTFLYENKSSETRDFLQCQEASAIDVRGNQFQTYEVYVAPNKNMRAEKIKSYIQIKGNFVFKTDETNFPIFRILKILVYPKDNMSSPKEVIFENVAVLWE